MGNYWGTSTVSPVERFVVSVPEHGTILLNQATCTQCGHTLRDEGICPCGNVKIDGGTKELGRIVKDKNKYIDCNLIEYKGQKQ